MSSSDVLARIAAREAAARAAEAAWWEARRPAPEPVELRRAKLQARLEAARRGFDPTYAYSDEPGYYIAQRDKEVTIAECLRELERLQ